MALLLAWFSLGTCLILSVACVLLFYDAKGQRRAFGTAEATIAALQARVADQEAAIGRLTSAVSAFAPLALVEGERAPVSEGEPAPMSGQRPVEVDRVPTLRTGTRTVPPPVAARLAALRNAAEARGMPAEHCGGRGCKSPRGCVCPCDACERLHIFERLAEVQPNAAADLAAAGEASLSPDELARVDALAEARGITRQDAIVLCLLTGAGRPAND